MMKKTIWLAVICLSLIFPALNANPQKNIKLTLAEKQVQDLSPSGLKLVFYVNLSNSSSDTYYLSGYSYQFLVGQDEYVHLSVPLDPGLQVPAVQDTMIAIPVKITYELLFRAVPEFSGKDMIQCFIRGDLGFSDERRERGRIPFSFSGEFPIFKEPQVRLDALNINTLTIGGADLDFEVTFSNPNNFELMVDEITYSVKIGGHAIHQSRIQGDKNIPKRDEKKFFLPTLVNFYDVGKDVYALLQQDNAACSFRGEMKLRTIWGRISLPYDFSDNAPIQIGDR
jgi:LEA14-like dessication related protein